MRPAVHFLPVLLLLSGCTESPVSPPDVPEVPSDERPRGPLSMQTTIDGFRYAVTDGVGFTVSTIEVNKGGILVSADVVAGAGHLSAALGEYRLAVTGADGGALPERVVYTPTGAFGGSLYWIAPGQAVGLSIGLYHVPAGRYVLGPYPVTVVRRGDAGTVPGPDPELR